MNAKPPEKLHDEAEFQNLRNHLINKLGFASTLVDAAIGTKAAGRTYRQITVTLALWLRTRPHK